MLYIVLLVLTTSNQSSTKTFVCNRWDFGALCFHRMGVVVRTSKWGQQEKASEANSAALTSVETHQESLPRAVWAVPARVAAGGIHRSGHLEGNFTEGRFWAEKMSPKTGAVNTCCGMSCLPLYQNSCDYLQAALKRWCPVSLPSSWKWRGCRRPVAWTSPLPEQLTIADVGALVLGLPLSCPCSVNT